MEWVTSATVILVKSEFAQDVIGIVFNSIPPKINILLSYIYYSKNYYFMIIIGINELYYCSDTF